MNPEQLKAAVMAMDPESKKAFILNVLPDLLKEAMQDRMFLMQLFPIFVTILQESGIELQQLLQLASLLDPGTKGEEA